VVAYKRGQKELADKPSSTTEPGEPFVCENDDETYAVLCNVCDNIVREHFTPSKKRSRNE
jgi:hypothetical protein